MKAQFLVTVEGEWLENGKAATVGMAQRRLRERAKDAFEFLSDSVKVSEIDEYREKAVASEPSVTAEDIKRLAMSLIGELTGGMEDAGDDEGEAFLNGSARGIGSLCAGLLKLIASRAPATGAAK